METLYMNLGKSESLMNEKLVLSPSLYCMTFRLRKGNQLEVSIQVHQLGIGFNLGMKQSQRIVYLWSLKKN